MRITIRELLGLTLAVGLGLGWWVDHAHWRGEAEQANRQAAKCEVQLAVISEHLGQLGLEADITDQVVEIRGTTTKVRENFHKRHLPLDEDGGFSLGVTTASAWVSEAKRLRHETGKR